MNVEKTRLYSLARILAEFVYRVIFRAKVRGAENFPNDRNCILLGNHISGWDPLTVAVFYKTNEVHFFAKESLFRNRLLAALLRRLHAFPVNRGATDMGAMRTAMQVLKDGHVLGIFPEGSRQFDGKVKGIETGVAVLALKSGAAVIPVRIGGKYRFFGKIRMVVGSEIPLDDLRAVRADAQTLEAVKTRVIDALEAMRPMLDF